MFDVGAAHEVGHVEEGWWGGCWVANHIVYEGCAGVAEEGAEEGGDAFGEGEYVGVGWVVNIAHSGLFW